MKQSNFRRLQLLLKMLLRLVEVLVQVLQQGLLNYSVRQMLPRLLLIRQRSKRVMPMLVLVL
jgi:hypothetical protein